MNHKIKPMIPLKYIEKDDRWVDKKSNIARYRSFFSDTMDRLNDSLPLSYKAKQYYIQGLAIIETKAYFKIVDQRCWVSSNAEYPPKIYEDGGQSV